MKILVTGSRTWTDVGVLEFALRRVCAAYDPQAIVIVHGAAQGADLLAAKYAHRHDLRTERHPADWQRYGKAAGVIRNAEMVAAGADLCLAFIRDGSRGATHCADLAEKAGIPTRRYLA